MTQFTLPAEVWIHVFDHLEVADKFSVRATCRRFKKLVDRGSLWRNWAVVLDFQRCAYNPKFWVTLRRRRVYTATVRSSKVKDWRQMAAGLPALSTLVIEHCTEQSLDALRIFTQLKRLALRAGGSFVPLVRTSQLSDLHLLTHLSLCGVQVPATAFRAWKFPCLSSLICHLKRNSVASLQMFYSILSCFQGLKHLSWSMSCLPDCYQASSWLHTELSGPSTLSSFELVDYQDPLLPGDVMEKLLPGLEKFSVFYKTSNQQREALRHELYHMTTWLSDLQGLSSLLISRGPPIWSYVNSIPSTVTSLTLTYMGSINLVEMEALATRVPQLLHLHLDPWPSYLGVMAGKVPGLFPCLRSLKLRLQQVEEKEALQLQELRNLRNLCILDGLRPGVDQPASKLRGDIHPRVRVSVAPPPADQLACVCVLLH